MKTQRIALPVWADNICPVLDFTRSLLVVDLADAENPSRETFCCPQSPPIWLANRMSALGVDLVICGALSYGLLGLLQMKNIAVVPYIQGSVNDILNAYLAGTLSHQKFRLPGMPPTLRGHHGHRKRWMAIE